jgi:hypothetical protein
LPAEEFVVNGLVEAHHEGLPLAEGRGPQVAGRAEDVVEQGLLVRRVLLQVEGDDLAPARGDDLRDVLE